MDIRIETFLRDVASDRGKPAAVVSDMARLRLSRAAAALRAEAGPAAIQRERAFLADLETRLRDEMSRYVGTRTEAHLAVVLDALHAFMRGPGPEQLVA